MQQSGAVAGTAAQVDGECDGMLGNTGDNSAAGRVRSAPNFRYREGFQSAMGDSGKIYAFTSIEGNVGRLNVFSSL
jgi:hypothetical protein